MAITEGPQVEVEDGAVHVREVTLEDADAAAFLDDREDDEVTELVTKAFDIGMTALRLTQTSVDVEFVERKFGEMVSKFSEEVDAATDEFSDDIEEVRSELDEKIGEDGRLDERFESYLGEDGRLRKRLEAAFDEDGPFHERLDEELGEDGERIRAALDPNESGTPTAVLKDELETVKSLITDQNYPVGW